MYQFNSLADTDCKNILKCQSGNIGIKLYTPFSLYCRFHYIVDSRAITAEF